MNHTFLSRLSQKDAMSSADDEPATFLLQKDSNASLSDLWNRDACVRAVQKVIGYSSKSLREKSTGFGLKISVHQQWHLAGTAGQAY